MFKTFMFRVGMFVILIGLFITIGVMLESDADDEAIASSVDVEDAILDGDIIDVIEMTDDCDENIVITEVRGTSMAGIVEPGESVAIDYGYYDCHDIKTGDIVIVYYSGNDVPLIKSVFAVPGDRFELSDGRLLVNGAVAVNSLGDAYYFSGNAAKMLMLYQNDYEGLIPANGYLVLGNKVEGTIDSTRFGLIDRSNIIGYVKEIK